MTHALMQRSVLQRGTMTAVLMNLISELQAVEHGQLIDKSRVIDHLLDLRHAATGDDAMCLAVDRLLADTPGKSMVEATWWKSALVELAAARQLTH